MSNVLNEEKRQQVIALGRLGWSLRRIEQAAHIRRETIGAYLRAAGIPVRSPGRWGRTTPKPANEVITGFLPEETLLEQGGKRSYGASEAYRERIELELSRGRNAMGIWQLCRDRHSCQNAEFSTMPSRGHLARAFMLQTPIVTDILRGPLN